MAVSGKTVVHIGISKRVAPLATRRNRLKRLLREVLRRKIRLEAGKVYWIRVDRYPVKPSYEAAETALLGFFK